MARAKQTQFNKKDVLVQSHYSVCIAYANFRKRMQISEKLFFQTPPIEHRPLQTYE